MKMADATFRYDHFILDPAFIVYLYIRLIAYQIIAAIESITADQTISLLNGKIMSGITRAVSAAEEERKYETFFKDTYNLNLDLAEVVYVANINEGLQLLRSHKSDAFEVFGATAYYIVQQNDDLKMYVQEFKPSTVHMLFNKNKAAQFELVDSGIRAMFADGTLDNFKKQWIEGGSADVEPTASPFSRFGGSETIRVGFTGEEPPMDYLSPSGTPSGYAVAVLAEIGARKHLNFEMVKIKTGDRFASLQSGAIDAFLWKTEMGSMADYPESKIYDDIDPAIYDFIFTYPYLETTRALIVIKKQLRRQTRIESIIESIRTVPDL